jgi:hypothetical protein
MNDNLKKNLFLGLKVAVVLVAGVVVYKVLNKAITNAKIRKAIREQEEKDKQLTPEQTGVVKPEDYRNKIGKKAYAKDTFVNVRSGAWVDNGFFNNFIGKVAMGKEIGKVLDGTLMGDGYVWYRLALTKANLQDDKDLGKANKNSTTGFVRNDVVNII